MTHTIKLYTQIAALLIFASSYPTKTLAQPVQIKKFGPISCEMYEYTDCNYNGRNDFCEIEDGSARDCDHNQLIDACERDHSFGLSSSRYLDSGANSQLGVVMADFNRDGRMDLATADGYNTGRPFTGRISVRLATAAGQFAAPVQYQTSLSYYPPDALAQGDIDGDGDIDLAFSAPFSGGLYVLRNSGNGGLDHQYQIDTGLISSNRAGKARLAITDLDGNNTQDIVLMNTLGNSSQVVILSGTGVVTNGRATFSSPTSLATGINPFDMTIVKLRPGNAPKDIVVANFESRSISLIRKNGSNWSTQQFPVPGFGANAVAAGDFTGDGLPDIAVETYYSISLLANDGNGSFRAPVSLGIGAGWAIKSGDLDGDGSTDIAVIGTSGTATALLQRTPGAFVPFPASWSIYNGDGLELLDINHDGKLDFVIRRIEMANRTLEYLQNTTIVTGPSC